MRGGIDPRDCRFRSRAVRMVDIWKDIADPRIETYPPRVRRDFDVVQSGNSRRALAP